MPIPHELRAAAGIFYGAVCGLAFYLMAGLAIYSIVVGWQ